MGSAKPLIGIPAQQSKPHVVPHSPLDAVSPPYVEGVLAGGGAPLQIPYGVDREGLRAIFERVDGLLLAGGGDVDTAFYGEAASQSVYGVDRERDEIEMALVRWALEDGKPLLAICRGIQVMNVALGGNLYQDIACDMPGAMDHACFQRLGFDRDYLAHNVQLSGSDQFVQLIGSDHFSVNSLHHQGVKRLASELTAVGRSPDGLVEAVEVEGHVFAVGVQWHPEALAPKDPAMQHLFEGLVEAARNGHGPVMKNIGERATSEPGI